MVEFLPATKTFNGNYLVKRISDDSKSASVNKPYVYLPPALANSMQL